MRVKYVCPKCGSAVEGDEGIDVVVCRECGKAYPLKAEPADDASKPTVFPTFVPIMPVPVGQADDRKPTTIVKAASPEKNSKIK